MTRPAVDHELRSIIAQLPKVELHVHLEGSVRPETLSRIARRNGRDIGTLSVDEIRELFRFRDFFHFTQLFEQCVDALREPRDFELITTELGLAAHAQQVRYLEVTFTPGMHHRARGIGVDEQLDAVAAGAAEVYRQTGVQMRFILDHVRGDGEQECLQTAQWCHDGRRHGVVALGLGGFEPGRPASLFAEAIGWAAAHGVPFVPHAGEAVGPEGVWDCLRFDPPRIGHGVRAAEDPQLLATLHARGVVLEICPTSNLRTGVVADLADHPLPRIRAAGVPFTLNSDDPSMFHTDITTEYRLATEQFGFTLAELAAVTRTGVDAALLPEAERAALRADVDARLAAFGV
ncbi:adenosine deaminase [Micromonospora sp. CPCC 206060]|uniref:adenosine deaminase n=1 Tax=Micromonospora sp. CPCC 206060 TaxID=3122406 RepID=UPI002FF36C4F